MDGSHAPLPEDLKRRRFTAADVQAMLEAGILKDREKFELIRGELIEMSPQGPLHRDISQQIMAWVMRRLPQDLTAAFDGPVRLGIEDEPEPELVVYPAALRINDVRGADMLLVVEVSYSSVRYDLNVKGPLYASHGVREYWVVDVKKRRTLVHKLNAEGAYGEPTQVSFDAPLFAPGVLSLTIADLEPKS